MKRERRRLLQQKLNSHLDISSAPLKGFEREKAVACSEIEVGGKGCTPGCLLEKQRLPARQHTCNIGGLVCKAHLNELLQLRTKALLRRCGRCRRRATGRRTRKPKAGHAGKPRHAPGAGTAVQWGK